MSDYQGSETESLENRTKRVQNEMERQIADNLKRKALKITKRVDNETSGK